MSPLTISEGAAGVGGLRGGSSSGVHAAIWLRQFVEHLLGVGHWSTTNPRCGRARARSHQGENPNLTWIKNRGNKLHEVRIGGEQWRSLMTTLLVGRESLSLLRWNEKMRLISLIKRVTCPCCMHALELSWVMRSSSRMCSSLVEIALDPNILC